MRLGFAAVAAPLLAMMLLAPQAMLRPDLIGISSHRGLIASMTSMVLGDLLGILLLAPPILLVAATGKTGGRDWPPRLRFGELGEIALVLLVSFGMVALFWQAGLSFQATPVLIAMAWVGLRYGRVVAWCGLLLVNVAILPFTILSLASPERIQWHLGLASVMIVGYLAGSYADAEAAAKSALHRSNRLLLQADRLKTLRAMSVSIIHDVSQPLTTLALEAGHLRRIETKAQGIATLVKRLRRFGERGGEAPTRVSIGQILDMACELIDAEFKARGVSLIQKKTSENLWVEGQEIELTQALVNLLRNALGGSIGGGVELVGERVGDKAVISVRNTLRQGQHDGMGLGLIIARTVVEAYGGQLDSMEDQGQWLAIIRLPLITGAR
jgi:signal transduction histidine kinase